MADITLPIDMSDERRWRIGDDSGELFKKGEEFDGLSLTIELRSPQEAKAVLAALIDNNFTK